MIKKCRHFGSRRSVTDGNHRGVAALEMRHMKIPVVHRS